MFLGNLTKIYVTVCSQTLSQYFFTLKEFIISYYLRPVSASKFKEIFNLFLTFLQLSHFGEIFCSQTFEGKNSFQRSMKANIL